MPVYSLVNSRSFLRSFLEEVFFIIAMLWALLVLFFILLLLISVTGR